MTDRQDIERKFWKALRSDRTAMLSTEKTEGAQPMTILVDGERDAGPLWIFTSKDTELGQVLTASTRAHLAFSAKGHDVFASLEGVLTPDNNREVIDRLWNPFVAAWYEEGKTDPKLQLLRFDATDAKVWIDASSLLAGIKILLGVDPKSDYTDKVGHVAL